MDKPGAFADLVEKYVERRVELMRYLLLSKGDEELKLRLETTHAREEFRLKMIALYATAYGDGYRDGVDEADRPEQAKDE